MSALSRADRQTAALVSLLRALPEAQLVEVLDGVDATLDAHEFERPRPPGGGVPPPETIRAALDDLTRQAAAQ